MRYSEIAKIKSVEYDVETPVNQPDVALVFEFMEKDESNNMCITYEDEKECHRRRFCIQTAISKSEFKGEYVVVERHDKIYIVKNYQRRIEKDE